MTSDNSELFTKLKGHILTKWTNIVNVISKGKTGNYFFIKTMPPENTKSKNKLSVALMNCNNSVYLCFSDHEEGVYERLKNKNTDGTYFLVANDENKISGDHVFGKDNGSKITPTQVKYLNIHWLDGTLLKS